MLVVYLGMLTLSNLCEAIRAVRACCFNQQSFQKSKAGCRCGQGEDNKEEVEKETQGVCGDSKIVAGQKCKSQTKFVHLSYGIVWGCF